jgi:hypothetical protein
MIYSIGASLGAWQVCLPWVKERAMLGSDSRKSWRTAFEKGDLQIFSGDFNEKIFALD